MKYIFRKQIIVLAILSFLVGASIIQSINADLLKTTEKNMDINDTLLKSQKNTHTLGIDENQPPIADFQFEQDPTNQYVFHFYSEGYSYDPDGQIIYWRWNFNDGTPDSLVLNISNPTYDFSHIAGHDLTISLIVGDDGIPQLFNSTYKIISIPDQNGKSNPAPENIYSSSYYLKSTSLSDKTLEKQSLIAGDCDLFIYNLSYSPADLRVNRYIYISFNVGDMMHTYNETFIEIEIFFPEFDFYIRYLNIEYDNSTKTVHFKIPDIPSGIYQLLVYVLPIENQGWNETNISNNEIDFVVSITEEKTDFINQDYTLGKRTLFNIYDTNTVSKISYQSSDKELQSSYDIDTTILKKHVISQIGGDCDLAFLYCKYCNKIRLNRFLTFYCGIFSEYLEYNFKKVIVQLNVIELDINITFDLDYDGQGHEVFFRWPNDAVSTYSIVLYIYPFLDGGWNDIDYDDNYYRFWDLDIYQDVNLMLIGLISNMENYYGAIKFNPIFVIMLPSQQKIYTSGTILLQEGYKGYLGNFIIFSRGRATVLS